MPYATPSNCQRPESSRRPRLSLLAILINTQPIGPTTNLRFVPVTRCSALILRRSDTGGRLDASPVGVASAVTSNAPISFDYAMGTISGTQENILISLHNA